MTADLWSEASRDLEAEASALHLSRAKVATASLWPFLSLAQSPNEFEHRLAIAADKIADRVGEGMYEPVVASLREDFRVANGMPVKVAGRFDGMGKGISPEDEWHGPYEVVQHPETGRHHVVDNQGRDATVLGMNGFEHKDQAERSRDYIDGRRSSKEKAKGMADSLWGVFNDMNGFADDDDARNHRQNKAMMELQDRYKGGSGQVKYPEDGDPYYELHHPSGWIARHHGGPSADVYHQATPDESHDMLDLGNWSSEGHKLPEGFGHQHLHDALHEFATDPDGTGRYLEKNDPRIQQWNRRNPPRQAAKIKSTSISTGPQQYQIFHVASQQWINVQGAFEEELPEQPDTRHNEQANPAYFAEAGPMTGETGTFPQHPTGADPFSPLQQEFPMQPTAWSGEGKPGWVDNPMNFAPYRQANANPHFFEGGTEGVAGDEQTGFPEDEALPEPDDRVDMYGTVPPQQSAGSSGDGHPYSNQSNLGNTTAAQEPRPFSEGRGFFDPGDASVHMVTTAAGMVRQRPDQFNPSGVQDEYEDNTWEGPIKQRPMQSAGDRGINTPQQPQDPIPQASSTPEREDNEEDGERREARRKAFAERIALTTAMQMAAKYANPRKLVAIP